MRYVLPDNAMFTFKYYDINFLKLLYKLFNAII